MIEDSDARMLRALFADRDRLAESLRQTDAAIMVKGRDYGSARGCLAYPRPEALRRAVSE